MIHKFSAALGKFNYRERGCKVCIKFYLIDNSSVFHKQIKGVSFKRNCGAASVGVLQDNLVLSTELIM